MLTIRQDILDSIIAHARAEHPNIACGLIAGPADTDRPERLIRMANAAHARTNWEFDPLEQFQAWRAMERRGEEPVVIYYSQNVPGTYPSRTTIAHATNPSTHYLVISTADADHPEFRSFRIRDGEVVQDEIEIVGAAPSGRERLFLRAYDYGLRKETWDEAVSLWPRVIAAYRDAVAADPTGIPDRRQLARALWRHAMLRSARAQHADALAMGREAVTVFERVHADEAERHPEVTGPERDEALGDLLTAMADLGEISFAAGDAAGRVELLDRALRLGLRTAGPPPNAGPRTRQAMGTVYHNHAVALLNRAAGQGTEGDARQGAMSASRAVELRQNLLDGRRPISGWELANTYLIYARCLMSIGDFDRVDAALELTDRLLAALGPAYAAEFAAQRREIGAIAARVRRR